MRKPYPQETWVFCRGCEKRHEPPTHSRLEIVREYYPEGLQQVARRAKTYQVHGTCARCGKEWTAEKVGRKYCQACSNGYSRHSGTRCWNCLGPKKGNVGRRGPEDLCDTCKAAQ